MRGARFLSRKDRKENNASSGGPVRPTVRDMQEVFGFATPQAIYKWIHGTAMPTIDNMVILAALFGVTVDEIVAVDMIEVKIG